MPDWALLFYKVPAKPPRELQILEEDKLMLALRNDVVDAVDFMLKSGWRRAEVLGLRWEDLNLPAKSAVTKIKGGDYVSRPLTTALVEIIARQPQADTEEGKPFRLHLCLPEEPRRSAQGQALSIDGNGPAQAMGRSPRGGQGYRLSHP